MSLEVMNLEVVKIASQTLEVSVALLGAEVRSVKNLVNQHEYMWSGAASIWAGVSPVLFPLVGKSTNNQISSAGQSYPMGNHGFARHRQFKILAQSSSAVTLVIVCNENGQIDYPFSLEFQVSYQLDGSCLRTTYQVINHGTDSAYFSVGAHPAFKCPFDDMHTLSDYVCEFEHVEAELTRHEITSEAFYSGVTQITPWQSLALSPTTFAADALVYSGFTSTHISLRERGSSRQIRVSLAGFPWLGLWSKPAGGYLCIEPWCGRSDMLGFSGEIAQRADIESLAAHGVWQRAYDIEFGY